METTSSPNFVPFAFYNDEWEKVCPECGQTFPEYFDPKADMGCGAMVSDYPQHYVNTHA